MVLFTKLLTTVLEMMVVQVILSMVLFTKLLTTDAKRKPNTEILSMVLFTKLLTRIWILLWFG